MIKLRGRASARADYTATMPSPSAATDVHAKALAINLDPSIYGTIAEIGAGQEVARWFLRVGAASGTVAQTISAYDKTVSDERYGAGTRYVSRQRLLAMLDREYAFLLHRLAAERGPRTRFFVFADTAAARNYRGDNQQHGWVGVRFQTAPGAEPSDVLLHVNLRDPTAALQAEALGLLGVNLIHAAHLRHASRDEFLDGLFDELSVHRVELDVIELRGPAFGGGGGGGASVPSWCVGALRRGMCHAILFNGDGRVVEPSAVLRKRPLIVERGRFVTPEPFHAEMLSESRKHLREEGVRSARAPASVFEMTVHHAEDEAADAALADDAELLARVHRLLPLAPVIVTDFRQTFHLVQYLRRHTSEPLRLAIGVSALAQLMQRHHYEALPGTLLEGLGKLLARNVKIYAYPMPREAFDAALRRVSATQKGSMVNSFELFSVPADTINVAPTDLRPPPPLDHLYRYLLDAGWIVPLQLTLSRTRAWPEQSNLR